MFLCERRSTYFFKYYPFSRDWDHGKEGARRVFFMRVTTWMELQHFTYEKLSESSLWRHWFVFKPNSSELLHSVQEAHLNSLEKFRHCAQFSFHEFVSKSRYGVDVGCVCGQTDLILSFSTFQANTFRIPASWFKSVALWRRKSWLGVQYSTSLMWLPSTKGLLWQACSRFHLQD